MTDKLKILVCGDVEGKFEALFKRISTINKKSGPFDCLFCVGNFFGINNKEFDPYKKGEKSVPVPCYILGPNNSDHVPFYPNADTIELCDNVYCLGKRGVYSVTKGLKVAYISGIFSQDSNEFEYNPQDISDLYNACVRGNPLYKGVDILLTSQWPSNVSKTVSLTINKTTPAASWLALKLKPRYHISGLEGLYHESAPFRCSNLGEHDTTLSLVTRFIGLARVGNLNKDKWLYALNLTPLESAKTLELLQKTTDEVDCPFDFDEIDRLIFNTKKKNVSSNQYFYDTNAPEDSRKHRNKRQKVVFDQNKCWFCLASPSVEKHLIITVANLSYLALAKGGLVDEHFLISPIEHYQNLLDLPADIVDEIDQFKAAICKFYARRSQLAVFFERNFKTSHMQLHALPVPAATRDDLFHVFMEEAGNSGFEFEELQAHSRLNQVLQKNVPYFTAELPEGKVLYSRVKGNFPLNFGREVMAARPILDLPDRVDWQECVRQRDKEEELVKRIRNDFEPFDFTV